jgi:hypothetical protein
VPKLALVELPGIEFCYERAPATSAFRVTFGGPGQPPDCVSTLTVRGQFSIQPSILLNLSLKSEPWGVKTRGNQANRIFAQAGRKT